MKISGMGFTCWISVLIGFLAIPLPVLAQTEAVASKKILMVLWRGITEPELAFKARLAALGVKAEYTELVGDQDRAIMAGELRAREDDFANKKYDIIYSFGTTATKITEFIDHDRIPIVFNIVFDPVGGELVKSLDRPGVNVTGVTYGVPINDQMDAFNALTPIKNLVVLFNAREPNANMIAEKVSEWADKHAVFVQLVRIVSTGDSLDRALQAIKSGEITGDALYAGADSFLSSKSDKIQAAIGDKIKLYGGTETFVLHGWLAAFSPTIQQMGGDAAELVAKILDGADASQLPVILPTPSLIISKASAHQHAITPPPGAILDP